MSESHDNPTLPHGGLGNNPTVLHDASTLADTAMTSIGNPEDLSAESKFDTSGARRRRDEDADEQVSVSLLRLSISSTRFRMNLKTTCQRNE